MRQLEQALKIDPDYGLATAMLANCYATRRFQGWFKDYDAEAVEGLRLAERSIDLGRDDGEVLWRAANAIWHLSMNGGASARSHLPRLADQSELLDRAHDRRLDGARVRRAGEGARASAARPAPQPARSARLDDRRRHGLRRVSARQFPGDDSWAQKALRDNPRFGAALWFLAAAFGRLGQKEKATGIISAVLKVEPSLTISGLRARTMLHERGDLGRRSRTICGPPACPNNSR